MKKITFTFWLAFLSVIGIAQPIPKSTKKPTKPFITKVFYGETNGQKVYEYILENSNGMVIKVINYGGTISDIITEDRNGKKASVVLGFDSLKSYTGRMNALMGATVGRVANRIENKKFTLDGKEYILTSNIHGGNFGFDKKIWTIQEVPGDNQVAVKLNYFSKDSEEGYPGNLDVNVTYTLTNSNELKINYAATTDQPTPVVLTNHTYFNLSGGIDNQVLNTDLNILADQFLETNSASIPNGNFIKVKGTPYDFTKSKKIGLQIAENNEQLKFGNGYDATFVLRNQTNKLALAATAYEPLSGRKMQVFTTEPGLVLYTGNYLSKNVIGRGERPSIKNGAFCLETQHYPNSPNQAKFPNTILRPGGTFKSQTVYKFSVVK
jgi:aldose 1-epimerase